MRRFIVCFFAAALPLAAHDSWVQVNVAKVSKDQPVYVDLMLGNHGNEHRDFKLASKIPMAGTMLSLLAADGTVKDLKPDLIDMGSAEKEGFWSVKVGPTKEEGLYCISHTYDAIVTYAPERVLKGSKAFFYSGEADEKVADEAFAKSLGHPLEIIPLDNPVTRKAGGSMHVLVLYKGKPLADTVISCVPRGKVAQGEFDANYEARTSEKGEATLTLREANYYLIAVHHSSPEEKGEGYSAGTEYGATLTLLVSEK